MRGSIVGTRAGTGPLVLRAERSGVPRGQSLASEAEAILRQHLHEPLTITELCDALGASERSLHAAFRDHLGTTPKTHHKRLRLHGARQDLLHADLDTRVTDVALKWGFLHFGWFSHDYQRLFAETPSGTLRRVRRALPPKAGASAEPTRGRSAFAA
jgi:AraC family ethanolamine operon transcriptional activator